MQAKDKWILALDVDNANRAIELFEALRDLAGMFKIGMQLFTAAGPKLVSSIVARGGRVFLDLKYHDIPNTVALAGIEATRLGVSIFNIHASGGADMMKRTREAVAGAAARENLPRPKVIAVTLLTSINQNTLSGLGISDEPWSVVPRLALLAEQAGLDGVVASAQEIKVIRQTVSKPDFLIVTPAIRKAGAQTHDQRRFMTAGDAIKAGADYVVVGRPVLEAPDPIHAARQIVDEIADILTSLQGSADSAEQSHAQHVQ